MDLEVMQLITHHADPIEDDNSVPNLQSRCGDNPLLSSIELDSNCEDYQALKRSVSTVKVPDPDAVFAPPPAIEIPQILQDHRSSVEVCTRGNSVADYYRNLEVSEIQMDCLLPPKGHVDGVCSLLRPTASITSSTTVPSLHELEARWSPFHPVLDLIPDGAIA